MPAALTRERITAEQFRAARCLLGWSIIEASRRARVSAVTVMALERRMDASSGAGRRAVAAAYEAAGVSFHNSSDGGVGVDLKVTPASGPWSSIP